MVNLEEDDPISVSYEQDCPFDDVPTYHKNPELLKMYSSHGHDCGLINGIGRIGYMQGGKKVLWKDEDLAETFLNRELSFVEESHEKGQPFFLYYALHQPHVPCVPSKRFQDVTKLGPREDVIAEMDWCVGELLDKLEQQGIREETLALYSTNNGPVLDDGYRDEARELNGTHRPAGALRGGKYSRFEGGTRIPFIVSCPGLVRRGVSDALIREEPEGRTEILKSRRTRQDFCRRI